MTAELPDTNELFQQVREIDAREKATLDELTRRFDARLAGLQEPDAGRKVQALFETKGKLPRRRRPKAGASY